ncbi:MULTISPECIES: LrgB family protein [unclassified Fusibacter]|uniref:LrgB family protein n=1 Tax=unclassified Fusibacter TaxID=2624464 RepID=UPI001011DFC5|nr:MULTISPECIES: LrgB family protein [unclassified Fusibacter]MCK8058443.1 LrgB family protein [Fusibacter sp. A2]NPE22789.1 LrgB family protein [Fusibacter sp. A1]RXV60345.1 LrgB family protein [Fusibacter sp. A1]
MVINSAYFGIVVSLIAYEIGLFIYKKIRIPLLNPLLISIVFIIVVLKTLSIDFAVYNKGASMISFFLGPATIALSIPLYSNLNLLKQNFLPIIGGIFAGCISSISSVLILSKWFGLSELITLSFIPKSVTTPIGMELSSQLGGNAALTIGMIVTTGITGAVIGPTVFKLFGIKDHVSVGIAMGTASHAIGTSKAMELGKTQGAFSGLAIGISGLITVLIVLIRSIILGLY